MDGAPGLSGPRHREPRPGPLIARARSAGGFPTMHAFPPISNAPSNALCRRFDFTLRGERDFVYAGRTLRCNHWVLDLAPASA